MRHVRIYMPGTYEPGETIELSTAAGQHVGTVLRMQANDPLTLFRGDNREFDATIAAVHKKKVTVDIHAANLVNRESPRLIHLAQALSKGDRMEWIVQKAVELGVTSLTPLITAHCAVRLEQERLAKKQLQWQAIAIAACEQSGRNQVPTIHSPCSFATYLQQCDARYKMVLHPTASDSLTKHIPSTQGDIALLIGPEGGLSEEEIDIAKEKAFHPLSLGPRILRTETAAIAALSIVQALAGDL